MMEQDDDCVMPIALQVPLAALSLLWLFCGLFLVCEKYFVPSLEIVGERMGLPDSVQGATLLAVGSSLPELFTATIGLFVFPDKNPGPATNVGSAIFNSAVIIGGSAIVCPLSLRPSTLCRDGLFYCLSLIVLFIVYSVTSPGYIEPWESVCMVMIYSIYVYVLARSDRSTRSHTMGGGEVEFKVLSAVDDEEQLDTADQAEGEGKMHKDEEEDVVMHVTTTEQSLGPSCDGRLTHSFFERASLPFEIAFRRTMPNVLEDASKGRYKITALIAMIWIGVLTWLVVDIAERTANCVGIDANLTGVTILAVGSSLPDLFSSIIVAKEGKGEMAVANALGSNIFDILICLGVPFSLKSLTNGLKSVELGSRNTRTEFIELTLIGLVQMIAFAGVIILCSSDSRGIVIRYWHGTALISAYVLFILVFVVIDVEMFEGSAA